MKSKDSVPVGMVELFTEVEQRLRERGSTEIGTSKT